MLNISKRINRVGLLAVGILGLALQSAWCRADSLVYIVNGSQQFGTLSLTTGAFQQIGPLQPENGSFGLAAGVGGSLVTFAYSGNVYGINSATGTPSMVGASGLGDCATVVSPCGPNSANTLGGFNGKVYATDFQHNLYTVDPVTGVATLIGATGIAAVPYVPGSTNADGSYNFYDEAIFGAGGKLYATFDAFVFNFDTFSVESVVIAPALYQINPLTGAAMLIGSTDLQIGAAVEVSGVVYTFNEIGEIDTLDVTNGKTSFVTGFDPAAGIVQGAVAVPSAVPEPGSLALFGTGLLGVGSAMYRRMRGSIG